MSDDILLKLTDVPGESKKSGHEAEIDVSSVSFGLSNSVNTSSGGGGGGAGSVVFQDIHIVKASDSSSHELMKRCATGKPITEAVFTFRKQGGEQQEYCILTLSNVVVSSLQVGHGGGDPTESLSLAFDKYKFEYKEQSEDGSLSGAKTFGWDVKAAAEA